MSHSLTVTLVPGSDTASLLRIVSTLHSRGARVHELSFDDSRVPSTALSLRFSTTNAGSAVIEAALRRLLDVAEVTSSTQQRWGLRRTGN